MAVCVQRRMCEGDHLSLACSAAAEVVAARTVPYPYGTGGGAHVVPCSQPKAATLLHVLPIRVARRRPLGTLVGRLMYETGERGSAAC